MKLLLERGDVNPDSSYEYGSMPQPHAAGSRHGDVVDVPGASKRRSLIRRGNLAKHHYHILPDVDKRASRRHAGEGLCRSQFIG